MENQMNHTNEEVERVAAELSGCDLDTFRTYHYLVQDSSISCAANHLTKMSEVIDDSARKTTAFNEGAKFSMELVASLQSDNQRMREALENVEWAAVRRVGGYTVAACPCCYGGNPSAKKSLTEQTEQDWKHACPVTEEYADEKLGHRKDCSLNAAINS